MSKTNAPAVSSKKDLAKKDTKEMNLNKENAKKAAEKVLQDRVTKYIYPENVTTSQQKKEFRRKARAAGSSFEKQITVLTKSKDTEDAKKLKQIQSSFEAWKKETLTLHKG